jgi:predicted NUDIX family NTP pyrophosphohydrolase
MVPEIDRVAWFEPAEASRRLKPTQVPFVERLADALRDANGDEALRDATGDR